MKYANEMNTAKKFMADLALGFTEQKRAFIVVSHINPTSVPFIQTLAKNGRIAGVIAKPNSIHFPQYDNMHDVVPFLNLDKQSLLMPNVINEKIAPLIKKDESLTIIDIGGYFAGALKQLNALPNLAGIVEDTENGLQKYERALQAFTKNNIPILSVARSRAKDFEDYLIGRSIVSSSIHILKQDRVNCKRKNIGVIGFGEVGRGGAFYLRDNNKYNVSVFDANPQVQELIKKSGFNAVDRNQILEDSDILFCMTGNKSLLDTDIQMIKKGCFVAACTSADDEFSFKYFDIKDGESKNNIRNTAGINFINDGNAVNFVHPQNLEKMLSPYIYLTHSALLECAVKIDNNKGDFSTTNINIIKKEREKELISSFRKELKSASNNTKFINAVLNTQFGKKSK